MAAPAQFRALQPVEHEQRAFDAPQFLERQIELVLTAVGRELPQHDGRRRGAGLQRYDQAQYLAPVFPNDLGLEGAPPELLALIARIDAILDGIYGPGDNGMRTQF